MSEMIVKLNLEPLNIRRTNRRLTIFHKAINGHLSLPFGHPKIPKKNLVSIINNGGSWGLGALGPAILWGPLQGCYSTLPSWGVANVFWQQYIEKW